MSMVLTPTGFLKVGGAVLLALGLIGFTGVTNNIALFNLDIGENVAHTVLGIVGLGVAFGIKDPFVHRGLVAVLAITGFLTGIIGFVLPAGSYANGNFFGLANLENPADNLLHIVVGIWATIAVVRGNASEEMATQRA
jgi:hypothetical protein